MNELLHLIPFMKYWIHVKCRIHVTKGRAALQAVRHGVRNISQAAETAATLGLGPKQKQCRIHLQVRSTPLSLVGLLVVVLCLSNCVFKNCGEICF